MDVFLLWFLCAVLAEASATGRSLVEGSVCVCVRSSTATALHTYNGMGRRGLTDKISMNTRDTWTEHLPLYIDKSLTAETLVRFHAIPSVNRGGQSGTATCFSPSTPVFPWQHHCARTSSRLTDVCSDYSYECTADTVTAFERAMPLLGRSEMSVAVTTPYWLHLR